MADLTFKQLRTKLDTRLNDTSNTIWSSNFKDEFMYEALNDPYVYIIDRDKTTTTVLNQAEYAVPTPLTEVVEVSLDLAGNGYSTALDPSAYRLINGTIIFDPSYMNIPGGLTMIIAGKRHLDQTDIIPNFLVEYVLELSLISAWKWLANKLADNFLTNDMTMGDLLQKINSHERRAEELRRTLRNRWLQRI